jgi:hypothetical protein
MGASTVVSLCESFGERRHNLFHLGWIMEPGEKNYSDKEMSA